jgi:hypothetical protein
MDRRLTHEDLDWLRKMSELKVANRPPRGIPTSVARKLTSLGYVEARPGGENWERYSIARKGRAELAGRLYSAFRLLALAPFSAPANSRLTARAARRSVATRSFPAPRFGREGAPATADRTPENYTNPKRIPAAKTARISLKCRDRNAETRAFRARAVSL